MIGSGSNYGYNRSGTNRVRTDSESSAQSFQTSVSTVSSVSQNSQLYASDEHLPGARGLEPDDHQPTGLECYATTA